MKAFVINLDSATERMAFQKQQLQKLGIKFQRIPAYKIDSEDDDIFKKYHNTWQRPMSIAEVSCFFSHKKTWDLIIKNNEAGMILEDDAFLATDLNDILNDLQNKTDIDYVNLETRHKRRRLIAKNPKQKVGKSDLYKLYQGRSGAGGYILWPSGAKKLLLKIEREGIAIADKFINSAYSLEAYQVSPAPIIQIDQCELHQLEPPIKTSTSISSTTKNKTIDTSHLSYRNKRLMGQVKIGLNHLFHIHHAVQKNIEIAPSFLDNNKSVNE